MAVETDSTLRAVLRHLVDHGPISRPELCEGVGLARATVSSLVNELMRRDLVGEIPTPSEGRRGRPSYLLDLDDDRYSVVGAEIGLDRVLVAAYTLRGRELRRVERPLDGGVGAPRALLRAAAVTLRETIDALDEAGRALLGVGVSVPGLVDATSGTIKYVPSLGWSDVALRAGVEEALGGRGPVLVDNDANFAALAERRHRLREGLPADSLVYLTGTYGIGAGIVVGDRLWRGSRGHAGEVGHIMLDAGGLPCACGRTGCFETRAGLSAVVKAALAGRRRRRQAVTLAGQIDEVVNLAQSGDPAVLGALTEAGRWLGQGSAVVSSMLDPRVIMLGGQYTRLAAWLLEPARTSLGEALLSPTGEGPSLEVSALGSWAATEGAALAVLTSVAEGLRPLPSLSRSS